MQERRHSHEQNRRHMSQRAQDHAVQQRQDQQPQARDRQQHARLPAALGRHARSGGHQQAENDGGDRRRASTQGAHGSAGAGLGDQPGEKHEGGDD